MSDTNISPTPQQPDNANPTSPSAQQPIQQDPQNVYEYGQPTPSASEQTAQPQQTDSNAAGAYVQQPQQYGQPTASAYGQQYAQYTQQADATGQYGQTGQPGQFAQNTQYTQPGQPAGYPYPPQGASGQQYPPQGAYYYPAPVNQRWNALCIAGFALSFLFAPVGLILSIVALVQINKSHEKSKGMAIAGIVIGALGTIISIVIIALTIWIVGYAIDHSDDYVNSTGDYPAWCELGLDNGVECQGYEGNGDTHRQYDDYDLDELQGMIDQYATSLAAAK